MTRRRTVLAIAALALAAFGAAAFLYRPAPPAPEPGAETALMRFHAPVIGPADAPVTIVEFFDPACETCRAFYPVVKEILRRHPEDLRLVVRYAAFHDGSEEVVRILEAARRQDRFEPVLEAVLAAQPAWADHARPNVAIAWQAAEAAGLDVAQARQDTTLPEIDAVLSTDAADLEAAGVRQTPTFFVNGKPLPTFGAQQLYDLVLAEIGGD
jgi:protein-disulfide isomerase